MYSNGESEVVLGKAIQQHKLPREEIVVMTQVHSHLSRIRNVILRVPLGLRRRWPWAFHFLYRRNPRPRWLWVCQSKGIEPQGGTLGVIHLFRADLCKAYIRFYQTQSQASSAWIRWRSSMSVSHPVPWVSYTDVLSGHRFDSGTPIEETVTSNWHPSITCSLIILLSTDASFARRCTSRSCTVHRNVVLLGLAM